MAGNDFTRNINLVVAVPPLTNQKRRAVDRQIALRFFLDHTTPFSVDGHSGVAGAWVGQRDYAMASWTAGTTSSPFGDESVGDHRRRSHASRVSSELWEACS